MSELYKERYFDRLAWLLENYESLHLSSDEGLLLLMLEYHKKYHVMIDYALLQKKMNMNVEQIDALLQALQQKGYLKINIQAKGIVFDTDGVFEANPAFQFEEDLFDTFETEFKRPLTRVELQKMSDWLQIYDNQLILYALREAIIRSKYSFDYIDRILTDWHQRGFSVEDIENGKQYEQQ